MSKIPISINSKAHIIFLFRMDAHGMRFRNTLFFIQVIINIMSAPTLVGETYCFCPVRPSVRHTVCQRNSSETTEQNFMKLGR